MFINSDAAGINFNIFEMDQSLISTPFNTTGMAEIKLSFDEYFQIYNGAFNTLNETAKVDVWDGTTWQNVSTQSETTGTIGSWTEPNARIISIPIAYANAAMKIRFRYHAEFDFWWAIDNVKIIGNLPTQVQSVVNTPNPATAYLGPNCTAVFYDPSSGDLIAKIKNLSSHDYGCTTVEVDRAGVGQIPWIGPYKISAKSYKVTPTTNNLNGQYQITLYFKNAEIVGNTVKSIGKSSVNINSGNNIYYASAQVGTVFNTDYSYTATFDSGFSGFGLSDAQPVVGPLPVKLISFEGKNIEEGNQLNWLTAEETNNDYFLIERADNAKDFKTIGQIKGKGSTKENNNYAFLDADYQVGINYYRLKQLDIDGKYGFSKTIAVEVTSKNQISISPNPVQALMTISVPDSKDEMIEIRLINSAGMESMRGKAKVKNETISLNIDRLSAGLYFVIVKSKNKESTFKIMKQ
jgi:Secretion system C-terminal sorting domain